MKNSYQLLGSILAGFGIIFSILSYFVIGSIPLTALGIGCLIIGVASIMLPPNPVPKSMVREMLRNSATNIEALLEEFQVEGRALYLPPKEGYVSAFITIEERPITEIAYANEIPLRLLSVASGSKGVTIFPPASEIAKAVEAYEESSYEQLLNSVLVEQLEMAASAKAVEKGNAFAVEIDKPKIVPKLPRFNRSFGTLPSSIAASCLAFKSKKRIAIEDEKVFDDKIILTLRVFEKDEMNKED